MTNIPGIASKILRVAAGMAALSALGCQALAATPAWKPEKNVEIIVSSAAGGGNDRTARTIQNILQASKSFDVTVSVLNKPGGGGALAWAYLNQHEGNGHYLSTSISSLLTNYISGRSPLRYTDFTPIAQLFSEYIAFMVKSDSAMQTGGALVDRIRKDPGSLTITIGAGLGNHNHIALGMLAKAVGADPRALKIVVFKSSGEASTALMGGHVDLAISPASSAMKQMGAGRVKIIALTAPQRMGGPFAAIPTWQEQGQPVVVANWRGIIGPRNLTAAQVGYWESTFAELVKTDEWKRELETNSLQDTFAGAAKTAAFLDAEYAAYRTALIDLGLVRTDAAR